MPITYDIGTNTITVTGYTGDIPCTFEDIYQADLAGGWGVVSRQGNQFLFDCYLTIGDGSTETWFADTGKQVMLNDGVLTANYQTWVLVKAEAHFRLGTLIDAEKKTTRDGVGLFSGDTSYYHNLLNAEGNAEVKVYSGFVMRVYAGGRATHFNITYGEIYNTFFCSVNIKSLYVDIFNVQIMDPSTAYGTLGDPRGTIEQIKLIIGKYAIAGGAWQSHTIKNAKIRYHTYVFSAYYSPDCYFINFETNTWKFTWAGTSEGKMYRQYEFGLRVTDKDNNPISGATVTLKDKNGNQVFQVSTGADGRISTQTVSRGYYDQSHGDTLQEYSPHTLTIEKAGYQTYEKKFTLEAKTSWEIKLAKAVGVFLDFGRPVVNLKKVDPENKNVMVL